MNENTNNDEQDNQKGNAVSLSTVTIDLDALDSTEALSEDKLIFYDEYQRMVDNILKKARSNIKKIKSKDSSAHNNPDEDSQNTPNCFFINGPRGSGKSTLMRAVRQKLVKPDNTAADETTVKLYPLADIDPTELGKGENFFIYLLGKIYELLDKSLKRNNNNDNTTGQIREALNELRDMSSGLQILMASEEVLKNDDTPEFFLENCLEKCADSSTMRKKLSSLIDVLATIVKQDVFLVTIDDADLNFSKCEDVLEYIRKYMHSPRLIFLFAGDLQLYSQIVRGMQLHNFHEKQLRYDPKRKENRYQLLGSMEEQYMLKLFPVDNRVHISALKTIVDEKRRILIKNTKTSTDTQDNGLDIKTALTSYLKIKIEYSTIDTILQLPLRSVLFLLRYLAKNADNKNSLEAALYTWKGIQDVFQQSLIDYNVNDVQIGTNDIRVLQKTILEYHARAGLWHSDLSMQSNEGDTRARQVALYLAGAVSQSTMSLSAKIKYWCACFPLWQRIQEENVYAIDERDSREFLESCIQQANTRANDSWANLASAALAPDMDESRLFGHGLICLLNDDCAQDNEKGQDERMGFNSLAENFLNGQEPDEHNEKIATIAINKCLCRIDSSEGSHYYLSVYHLLMSIANWLDFGYQMQIGSEISASQRSLIQQEKNIKSQISAKMSEDSISAQTQLIMNTYWRTGYSAKRKNSPSSESANSNETDSPVQQLKHSYKCPIDDETVSEMCNWLKEYCGLYYVSSSAEFHHAWERFVATCSKYTFKYSNEYEEVEKAPKASVILLNYMKAVEEASAALPTESGHSLQKCITSFPLWKALNKSLKANTMLKTGLDKARIGYFVNTKSMRLYQEYKTRYDTCCTKLPELEMNFKNEQSKYLAAKNVLEDAAKQKAEKEGRYNHYKKLHSQYENELNEHNDIMRVLHDREVRIERDLAKYNEEITKISHLISKSDETITRLEKIRNGESDDFPGYKRLNNELNRLLKSKWKSISEGDAQVQQRAIDAIYQEIKKRQIQARDTFDQNALPSAIKEKRNLETKLENTRSVLSDTKSQLDAIAYDRSIEEDKLSEIRKNFSSLRKLELSSSLTLNASMLKYKMANTFVEESHKRVLDAKEELQLAKKLRDAALEQLMWAKTANPIK